MTFEEAQALLKGFKDGKLAESEVLDKLLQSPFAELDFAKVDLARGRRQGFPEVILGEGKTAEQIIGITRELHRRGQAVLVTRISTEAARVVRETFPEATHHETGRCLTLSAAPPEKRPGRIAIASGGTGDLPIAEEAAVTADFMGNHVTRIYDIGVACLHRCIDRLDDLRASHVIIVVAGMEGALPSVLAGLVDKPIIAVPTHIGYGANFGGMAALLGMLNSCGSGVTVVNIDNGFGAAFAANQINRLIEKASQSAK